MSIGARHRLSTGARVDRHSAPVDELFTPYIRPQESGGRFGVRHFSLTGAAGGLAVHLDGDRRQVSVTRYRAGDLDAARHHDELVPRAGCVVHVDGVHRGLGTASCGPDTLPPYLIGPGTYTWSWTFTPLPGPVPAPRRNDPSGAASPSSLSSSTDGEPLEILFSKKSSE